MRRDALVSPFLAGSAIYRLLPMFHLMLESVDHLRRDPCWTWAPAARRRFTLSPGFRGGWNVGDKQVIVGVAVPITWTEDTNNTGAFFYFSYELPFKR